MWGWDPSQGEGPAGGTTPTLLPSQSEEMNERPQSEPHPVLDVQGLKQQFQSQQHLLAQIKETLRENDADRTSKEKQLEMYANKLSQIKNRAKNARKLVDSKQTHRRSSKENLTEQPAGKSTKETLASSTDAKASSSKGKMNELKKQLEENKLKFEEQAERETSETKRIESMVEHLKTQVKERDVTFNELEKTMRTPPARPKVQVLPRKKDKTKSSQWTQTEQISEVSTSDQRIKELEMTIIDLEDTIKQQTSVITSRTQAVALLTQDLSKKSKIAVDDLEETRQEMRLLQNNFITIETQLKSELLEKDNRLIGLEDKIQNLESINTQLTQNCATVEAQLSGAVERCIEKDTAIKLLQESVTSEGKCVLAGDTKTTELEKKIEELTKDLDSSNKLMIRLKLEHKNKLKAANKSLDLLKKSSSDSGELLRLSARVEELEAEKLKMESKIAELEEEKATEISLRQSISDLESTLKQKESEIISFEQLVSAYETEKLTWQQCFEDQNILVDNLNSRIQGLEEGLVGLEPFEIPGDAASRQFDASNKELQKQIEELVVEKQGLLNKLKNLPSESSTESLTFEKVDMACLESDIKASVERTSDVTVQNLEKCLADEKQKSLSFLTKIKELEECIESLGKATSGSKGKNKRDLASAKRALSEEKERVKELCDKLEDKEKLIKEYIEKIEVFEKGDDWSKDLSETQRKCLSLENSLLELTEHCERLRKENIELSEEKVRQKRAEEEMAKTCAMVPTLQGIAAALEERVKALEAATSDQELHETLDYANIMIAGKDTEIFNLQSSLANRSLELDPLKEELESARDKLSRAEADLANLTVHASQINGQNQDLEERLQNLIGQVASQEQKCKDLEDLCDKQTADLNAKSEECARLIEERHRLQVSLETVMADSAIASQAKGAAEERFSALELKLQEADLGWELERNDWKNFVHATEEKLVRERNEAFLKGEEAEKVLQKTWAERNELIQSKQDLFVRLSEMEKALNELQFEKMQGEAQSKELSRRLDEAISARDVIDELKKELELRVSELERKKEEYTNLALKAKKLAANLKKKAQVEKELTEQLNSAICEKEELRKQVEIGNEEKWALEGSEKDQLLKEKGRIVCQNEQLLQEKEILLRQVEDLVSEKEMYIREAEAAFAEKCRIEEDYMDQEKRYSTFNEQIHLLLSERNSLSAKIEEIEKNWSVGREELETLKQLYEDTLKELDLTRVRLSALEQTFELEEHENEALLNQKAALLQEQEALISKCNEKENLALSLMEQNTTLLEDISRLKQTVESMNMQLETERKEKEPLLVSNKVAEENLIEAMNENKSLKGQILELNMCLKDVDAHRGSLMNIQKENEELTLRIQQLHTSIKDAENTQLKLSEATKENEVLSSKIQELQISVQDTKTSLEEYKEELMLITNEKCELQASVEKLKHFYDSQIDDLKKELKNVHEHKELHELERNNVVEFLETNNASLLQQLEERNNALSTEIARSNQVNEDLISLKSQFAEKEAEIQRLEDSNRAVSEGGQGNVKRKKSVTFKTDDGDYIRELRGEVSKLQEDLSEGKGIIAELEKELLKEKSRAEESSVDTHLLNYESSNPSIFFETAGGDFLSPPAEVSDPFSEESLAWDDGWGTEGQLEEAHALSKEVSVKVDPKKMVKLKNELKAVVNEKEKVDEDLRVLQVKYAKVVKKLKEQKLIIDRLQGELRMAKSGIGGDLDAAIMDELKEEIKRVESKENEARKELNAMKAEKEALLKRIDMLNAGNERFLELKERQDGEIAIQQQKTAKLMSEISNLQAQLQGPRPDDSELSRENWELKNLMEGLEWKISELTELVEEKDEELSRLVHIESGKNAEELPKQSKDLHQEEKSEAENTKLSSERIKQLEFELEEARSYKAALQVANQRLCELEVELNEGINAKSALETAQENLNDMEGQLSMLATENETLQGILNRQKASCSLIAAENNPPQILQYFQKIPATDFFEKTSATALEVSAIDKEGISEECEELRYELASKQEEILAVINEKNILDVQLAELQNVIRSKETELQHATVTLETERVSAAHRINELLMLITSKEDSEMLKDNEIASLQNQLSQNSSSSALISEENSRRKGYLQEKEEQVNALAKHLEEIQAAYHDAKSEIERLLNEERMRSDSLIEDDLAFVKRSVNLEKTELEGLLRAKDTELVSLKDCLLAAESELEEARKKNESVVFQLKAQLRDLDAESAHSSDEKDTEIAELRAEVVELQDLVSSKALEVRGLRDELTSLNKQYEEELALLPTLKNLVEERDAEIKQLKKDLENLQLVLVEKEAEMAELRLNLVNGVDDAMKINEIQQQLTEREEEVRSLKETLESVHAEISQFRSFEKQMKDLQMGRTADVTSNFGGDWTSQEAAELAGRLQSDLDTALYMLHQRDVRCEELTFELMQLLEERDTLQLRLSTVIRAHEELKLQVETADNTVPGSSTESDRSMRHLTDKISELHNVGYARDKNIQDESLQRHREQMALLNRDGRGKNRPVLDV